MARNYHIGEAVEIIAEGTDVEAIQDLGRRYPLLVAKVAKATSGSNVKEVAELFSYIPEYVSANKVNKLIRENAGLIEGKASDDDVEEEKPVKKAPAKKAPAKKATKSADPYAGKDAIELFKECKKRGIKAAAKKTAKFYANLLKKADEEAAAEAEEEDVDDWDEEEEEAPAPKKKAPAKKAAKKPEPEEDEDDEDDDDDDWDI